MMHRSAILGTAGLIVLAALGHVVISGLMPQREVAAEGKQSTVHDMSSPAPSRFSAPDSSVPLQPMPARIDSATGDWPETETILTSGESGARQSSRRRYGQLTSPALEPVPSSPSPAPTGLPSSLDEALRRLRTNPPAAAPEEAPQQSPELEAPQSHPQAMPNQPTNSAAAAPFRYMPASTTPAANGAASIGSGPKPSEAGRPQPWPSTEPAAPARTAMPQRSPATTSVEATLPTAPSGPVSANSLFAVNNPAVAIETTGPKTMVLGKPTNYRIYARNLGKDDARQLTIHVPLPQGIQLQDLRGTLGSPRQIATQSGGQAVEWDIPVLLGRNEGYLELTLIATQTRSFELGLEVAFAPLQMKSQLSVLEPKLEMVIEGPNDILFGDSQIFKVIARNAGSGPADNVSITIMPIKKGQNPTVIDSIGTIGPGDQKVLELELTAKQAGTLSLRAETAAENGLFAQAQHDVLVRRAELAVNAQGPAIKYAATTASYAVIVANAGNAPASAVQVEARLPEGSKFLSASHGGEYDEAAGKVVWSMPTLEPNSEKALQIIATLMTEGNNVLQVAANADQGLNSQHEMVTRVESVADLKLAVNDPTGPIPVGQEVEYEFRLNNRGTKEARGVMMTISFGNSIEPIAIEGGKGTIQGDVVQMSPVASVNAGQEVVVKVKARGRSEGNHTFRAEVRCEDPTTRLAIEESTHFYGAVIQTASPQMPAQSQRFQPPAGGPANPPASPSPAPLSPTPFSRYQ
ncbi:hypothetical protein [Bremerella cremea]|uniref:hypothetical protein n=1 Tax=Bremerella cremea TaxID=1031537 RepID=UPI0031E8AAAB